MLRKIDIKRFLVLFAVCLALEIISEGISTHYSIPWVSLIYNTVFCAFAFMVIKPYNKPENLALAEGERRIVASKPHKFVAMVFFLAWFALLFWVVSVLELPVVNTWYMIVPALPAAFGEELLYKGILFKYLHQEKRWKFWLAALPVTLAFALYHRQFNFALVKYTIWSIYSFCIYYHWRSLTLLGLFHYFHNLVFYFWIP